ncbi:AAA family ATPase [candidate division WWE3 bacterium]|uniref:AAA family ATPase n=1 Tax=candidate division WWE3 bacterium TaxID=2053526 RepID=A0A928TVR6_UNCKA|nr:AAA family ATPase [candidate division WWE3 bacterium]
MISSFKLKFGRSPGLPAETIATTPVTVFVGPNNSGKSRLLYEIEDYCRSGTINVFTIILDDLSFSGLAVTDLDQAINHLKKEPNFDEKLQLDHIIVGSRLSRHQVNFRDFAQLIQDPHSNLSTFCKCFMAHNTLMLDGHRRIQLVGSQGGGDLQRDPSTSFQVLFRNDEKRREVRRIVYESFGSYFVIDPTSLGELRIRLSDFPPKNNVEEQGLHDEARKFHKNARPIEETSDGVKAFIGIVTEIIAGDPRILLIDEPEAFLHPSLAQKLGNEISRAAQSTDKKVFVSTHSPAFVMGCIQSGALINIIRLTYRDKVATARVFPSNELLELMRNPLLRSTGVLSGLFYEFVIVTESDSDRAFYQEINERLLRFKPEWGIPNCLFINAQNKQTVPTILRPLRKLGIPALGVVDIDVIKEGGTVWTNLLSGANIPEILHESLASSRNAINQAMKKTGRDMKRDGGINILDKQGHEAAQNLLEQLGDYGIFVVPGGELESWLKHLCGSGHGPSWLIDIFEKMGEDPDVSGYLKPINDDVWSFMQKLKAWLFDSNRKGIPE